MHTYIHKTVIKSSFILCSYFELYYHHYHQLEVIKKVRDTVYEKRHSYGQECYDEFDMFVIR